MIRAIALIAVALWLPVAPQFAAAETFVPVYTRAEFRPMPRPGGNQSRADQVRRAVEQAIVGLQVSPRPAARTFAPRAATVQAAPSPGKGGGICGDPALRGRNVSRIRGRLKGCGVANPVEVTSVDGISLSTPATMDCQTAQALKIWVQTGVKKAVGRRGGGAAQLKVAASYACRSRNNRPGAKISEHGKGHAIDISAIILRDGSTISVLEHWGKGRKGKILATLHQRACGPFGTVLGPNSDRYHRDHFHFDTARYRKGSYCR